MTDRDALLRRANLLPDSPRFGGLQLRPFTLWTIDLCEEIGLEYFVALPEGRERAGDRRYQLAALLWFHDASIPCEVIDQHLMAGTWREQVKRFRRRPEIARRDVASYIGFVGEMIAAAGVKVQDRPKEAGEKPEKTPSTVIEPGAAYALIWSVTGGAIHSAEQERFLYRELPLARLLSYYHCALRAALLWTVPPGAIKDPRTPEQIAAAEAARLAVAERDREIVETVDFM